LGNAAHFIDAKKVTAMMAGWLCSLALITSGFIDAAAGKPQLPIAVIGDTQRTSWIETVLMFREENDRERELLLHHLFRAPFDLLVHLGGHGFRRHVGKRVEGV
jgi:hypothetical protein